MFRYRINTFNMRGVIPTHFNRTELVVVEIVAEDETQAKQRAKKAIKREHYEIIEIKQI